MFGVEDLAVDPRVASFLIRAIGRVVDIVVALGVGFVSAIIAIIVLAITRHPGDPVVWAQSMGGFSFTGLLVGFVGSTLYHSLSEYIGGASVGKLLCGVRVVSEEFGPVSFRGTLIRSVAFPIDGLFFGWIGYRSIKRSPLAQRVGDHWGRTTVVRMRAFRSAARGPTRVLLGVFLGLTAWVALQVILFIARVSNTA